MSSKANKAAAAAAKAAEANKSASEALAIGEIQAPASLPIVNPAEAPEAPKQETQLATVPAAPAEQPMEVIRKPETVLELLEIHGDGSLSFKEGAVVSHREMAELLKFDIRAQEKRGVRTANLLILAETMPNIGKVPAIKFISAEVAATFKTSSAWQNAKGLVPAVKLHRRYKLECSVYFVKDCLGYLNETGLHDDGKLPTITDEAGKVVLDPSDPILRAFSAMHDGERPTVNGSRELLLEAKAGYPSKYPEEAKEWQQLVDMREAKRLAALPPAERQAEQEKHDLEAEAQEQDAAQIALQDAAANASRNESQQQTPEAPEATVTATTPAVPAVPAASPEKVTGDSAEAIAREFKVLVSRVDALQPKLGHNTCRAVWEKEFSELAHVLGYDLKDIRLQ